MSLRAGSRIGSYEVIAKLGEGGMGEVYRARDTRLKREVALKILPSPLVHDRDRLARFAREAELLASLNHPNIAVVYGIEEAPDESGPHGRALVMELVEGEDLADRIARGALPVDEALSIAKQIADALETAHERGIVHRDLKPANVKVRPDGTVKVLDFGLAKEVASSGAGTHAGETATSAGHELTSAGIILGTAAYMSPEQARGKPVDRRTDIWAFGAVLFEMLTGHPAFPGDDVAEVMAAVLTREPDWTRFPADTPGQVARVIRRSLVKDPRNRLPHIGSARLEIDDALQLLQSPLVTESRQPAKGVGTTRRSPVLAAAALITAVAGGVAVGVLAARASRPSLPAPAPEITRLAIAPGASQAISVSGLDRDLAISPDGRRVAYVGGNATALLVRDLATPETLRIDVGGLPHHPFFSPDGQWIGFVDGFIGLKRVPAAGGRVETIARLTQPELAPSWGDDDGIVFAQNGGLWKVAAAGGTPERLLDVDRAAGQFRLTTPYVLPGARGVLFGIDFTSAREQPNPNGVSRSAVAVLDLKDRTTRILLEDATNARYVASGHLVFQSGVQFEAQATPRRAGDALRATRFDLERLETVGAPVTLDEPVFITPLGGMANLDISATGTLAYVPISAQPSARRLVWVDREGREEPINLPVRAYAYPSLSPSGKEVALDIRDQDNDIWIWDIGRNTLKRLTFERAVNQYAVWTPDGRRVLSTMPPMLRWQLADGSGTPETVVLTRGATAPYSFSPDGKQLVFRLNAADTGMDLMRLTLDGRKVEPLVRTRFDELNADISPDGRWIAYQSDESGVPEIYVRPFPDVNGGRWQVSTGGGRTPIWSRDGRELFYIVDDGTMMVAPIEPGAAFVARTPVKLFSGNFYLGGANSVGRTFGVAPDGRRFLMIKADAGEPITLTIVLNWFEQLKQRVATN